MLTLFVKGNVTYRLSHPTPSSHNVLTTFLPFHLQNFLPFTPRMVRAIPVPRPLNPKLITLFPGIPTKPGGGNHTKQFARSARTEEAHEATMLITKALALTCVKVIMDDGLFKEVSAFMITA